MQEQQAGFRTFAPILLAAFIDFMGVSLVLPVLEPMLVGNKFHLLDGFSEDARKIIYGLMVTSYPLAQFFGAPVLGAYSDRLGRKPLLLLSMAGSIMGYVLFAVGIMTLNLPLMFIGRIVDGFTGGNISIVFSAVADLSEPKDRAKNFGLIGATVGVGFVLGPAMGGLLADSNTVSWFGPELPFWVAGGLVFINLIFLWLAFGETLKERIDTPINVFSGIKNLGKAFRSRLRSIFMIVFFMHIGFTFFTQFFPLILAGRWGLEEIQEQGWVYAYVGIWMILTQGFILRRLTQSYSPGEIVRVSLLSLALSLGALSITLPLWSMYVTLPCIAISFGLSSPNLSAMVSSMASRQEQGQVLGLNQSISSSAHALTPIFAALLSTAFISLPIIFAFMFVLTGWLLYMWAVRTKRLNLHNS